MPTRLTSIFFRVPCLHFFRIIRDCVVISFAPFNQELVSFGEGILDFLFDPKILFSIIDRSYKLPVIHHVPKMS